MKYNIISSIYPLQSNEWYFVKTTLREWHIILFLNKMDVQFSGRSTLGSRDPSTRIVTMGDPIKTPLKFSIIHLLEEGLYILYSLFRPSC